MESRTGEYIGELSWAEADLERFPYGLDELTAANEALERSIAGDQLHELEQIAEGKVHLSRDAVFSNFGLMLGIFVPATTFLAFLFAATERSPLLILLLMLTNATTALVGYRFGRVVSRMITYLEDQSIGEYVVLSVFVGALWGIVAGGLGGLFLFLIGGIFGAIIGGAVGAVALPAFLIPYNAVDERGSVALSHFLPISVGVTSIICAGIIHLFIR